jgi:hypothetical protein
VARLRVKFLGVVCLAAAIGCGGLGKLHKVEGKAEVDGKPLQQGVKIQFWPQAAKTGVQLDVVGTVDSSGTYRMETNGRSGVPPGKYKVTVNVPSAAADPNAAVAKPGVGVATGANQSKLVNPKFEDQTKTDLVVSVPEGPFDLKFTK